MGIVVGSGEGTRRLRGVGGVGDGGGMGSGEETNVSRGVGGVGDGEGMGVSETKVNGYIEISTERKWVEW